MKSSHTLKKSQGVGVRCVGTQLSSKFPCRNADQIIQFSTETSPLSIQLSQNVRTGSDLRERLELNKKTPVIETNKDK